MGNLAFKTTEDGLRESFGEHGEITFARVISDRDSGRSRGFGFVTFASKEEAQTAIDALNETELDGRTIRVSPFLSRSPGISMEERRSFFHPPIQIQPTLPPPSSRSPIHPFIPPILPSSSNNKQNKNR